jgi:hypothetical protein
MNSKRVVPQLLILLIAALSMSCAARSGRRSSGAGTSRAAEGVVLTMAEMMRVAPGQSVWTAIERLRPGFLQGRGSVPTVSLDGGAAMELSVLRTIPVSEVREVRLLRGVAGGSRAAVLPNGDVVVGDVVLVLTRTR